MNHHQLNTTVAGAVLIACLEAGCYLAPNVANLDADRDGYDEVVDCDDDNPAVHPDAIENCHDQVDNDCDGRVDAFDSECDSSPGGGGAGATGGGGGAGGG